MAFILKYKYYLLPVAAALLVFLLRRLLRYRKARKKETELAMQQHRNEALTRALQNPMAKTPSKPPASNPLEIRWDEKPKAERRAGTKGASRMIELTELTDCSRRKYLFRADQTVRIGSGDQNELVLFRDGVEPQHCVIRLAGSKPCVYAVPGARSQLHRGKKLAAIDENGVYLNNADLLELGSARLAFRMYKA